MSAIAINQLLYNELLMENHESRPIGSTPFPEVNAASFNGHSFGHGRDRRHGRGKGYNHNYNKNTSNHQKWVNNKEIQEKDKKWTK